MVTTEQQDNKMKQDTLLTIGEQLRTQDNRSTMHPMFCVQVQERLYGFQHEWTGEYVWIDTEAGGEEVEAPADGLETHHIFKTGYKDQWRTVMVAVTEAGCQEHLRLNGHNYLHYQDVRIFVESFHRCPEMIAIREHLMNLKPEEDGNAGVQQA
jgi:hypothetical protein